MYREGEGEGEEEEREGEGEAAEGTLLCMCIEGERRGDDGSSVDSNFPLATSHSLTVPSVPPAAGQPCVSSTAFTRCCHAPCKGWTERNVWTGGVREREGREEGEGEEGEGEEEGKEREEWWRLRRSHMPSYQYMHHTYETHRDWQNKV